MALDKPYLDIPGTTVFDADMSRLGFHLNQFCMSLMNADNREAFKADERGYLDRYPIDLVDDRATQSGASSVEGRAIDLQSDHSTKKPVATRGAAAELAAASVWVASWSCMLPVILDRMPPPGCR